MCHAAAANLWLYGLTVSTLSALMHAQRKNANNGPALVQKLDWRRSDPVLDRPGTEPVTEPVRSLYLYISTVIDEAFCGGGNN